MEKFKNLRLIKYTYIWKKLCEIMNVCFKSTLNGFNVGFYMY